MLIDLAEEYKRMGLPNDYWQLSDVNRDYRVSGGISLSESRVLNPNAIMISHSLAWLLLDLLHSRSPI